MTARKSYSYPFFTVRWLAVGEGEGGVERPSCLGKGGAFKLEGGGGTTLITNYLSKPPGPLPLHSPLPRCRSPLPSPFSAAPPQGSARGPAARPRHAAAAPPGRRAPEPGAEPRGGSHRWAGRAGEGSGLCTLPCRAASSNAGGRAGGWAPAPPVLPPPGGAAKAAGPLRKKEVRVYRRAVPLSCTAEPYRRAVLLFEPYCSVPPAQWHSRGFFSPA